MSAKTIRIVVYLMLYLILGGTDLVTTRLLLRSGAGAEANPVVGRGLGGQVLSEMVFLTLGLSCLVLALKLRPRVDLSDGQRRTVRSYLATRNRSPRQTAALVLLLGSLLLLWIKFLGALNNVCLLAGARGVYGFVRGLLPATEETGFYWLFTVASDGLFLVGAAIFICWRWRRAKGRAALR